MKTKERMQLAFFLGYLAKKWQLDLMISQKEISP